MKKKKQKSRKRNKDDKPVAKNVTEKLNASCLYSVLHLSVHKYTCADGAITSHELSKTCFQVSSQDFRSNRPEFESFLGEMIRWFSDHRRQVDEAFGHSDTDKTGSVNLKDFELGKKSLNICIILAENSHSSLQCLFQLIDCQIILKERLQRDTWVSINHSAAGLKYLWRAL